MPFGGIGNLGGVGDIVAMLGVGGADKFNADLNRASMQVNKTAKQIDKALNVALVAGTAAFIANAKAAADFQSKMSDIHTLLGGSESATKDIERMNNEILTLSTQVPMAATSLSSAMYQIVSATVPPSKAMQVLETSAKAAVAGVANVTSSFNLFSAVIKGYGKEWEDVNEVSDIVFQTIRLGQTTMSELASSMQGAIPLAAQMGVEFDELSAAVATLTGITGNTSEVMTQLEGFLTALIKPTGELEKAFERLNVSSGKELVEKMGGLGGAMQALKEYTDKYDISIGKMLGRKEALLGYFALTGEQADDFVEKWEEMKNAVGSTEEAFAIKMQDFKNQGEIFKNIIQSAFIKQGTDLLLPTLTSTLTAINEHPAAVQAMVNSLSSGAMAFGSIAAAIKVANIAMKVFTNTNPVILAITGLVTVVMGLKTAYDMHQAAVLASYDAMVKEVDEVDKLVERYNTLNTKINPTSKESEELRKVTDKLRGTFEQAGIYVEEYGGNMNKAAEALREMRKVELQRKLDEINAKLAASKSRLESFSSSASLARFEFEGLGATVAKAVTDNNYERLSIEAKKLEQDIKALSKPMDDAGEATKRLSDEQKREIEIAQEVEKRLKALGVSASDVSDKQKLLEDANIATTESLQKQVEQLEALIPYVEEDAVATKQLYDKLLDLYTATDNYTGKARILTEKLSENIVVFGKIRGEYRGAKPELIELTDEQKKLGDEVKKQKTDWADYANLIGQLTEKLGAAGEGGKLFGQGLNLISTIAKGAFDPITLGLTSLNVLVDVFDVFSGNKTKHVTTIKEIKEQFLEMGVNIDKATEAVNNFQSAIRPDRLEDLKKQLEDTLEAIQNWDVYSSESLIALRQQAENLTAQINILTQAFQLAADFSNILDQMKYLQQQAIELKEYFGEAFEPTGIEILLKDSIDAAKKILEGLDPATQAYRDLNDEILQTQATMALLRGDVETLNEWYKKNVADVEILNRLLGEQNNIIIIHAKNIKELNEADKIYNNVLEQEKETLYDVNQQHLGGIEIVRNYTKVVQDAEQAISDKSQMEKDYLDILEKENQLFGEMVQQHLGGIEPIQDFASAVNETANAIAKKMEEEKNSIRFMEKEDALMGDMIENHLGGADAAKDYSSAIDEVTDSLSDTNDELQDQLDLIDDLTFAWDEMLGRQIDQYKQFEKDIKEANERIDELLYYDIDLDTTQMDEKIAAAIKKLQSFMATLSPNSPAYKDMQEALNKLIQRFIEIGGDLSSIDVSIDTSKAKTELNSLSNQINKSSGEITIDANTSRAMSRLDSVIKQTNKSYGKITIDAKPADAMSELSSLVQKVNNTFAAINIKANRNLANQSLESLKATVRNVSESIKIMADTKSAETDIAKLDKDISELNKTVVVTVNYKKIGTPPAMHDGGLIMHSGGLIGDVVKAHDGLLASNERLILALKDEFVMRPAVTQKFGAANLSTFNRTLDPSVLQSENNNIVQRPIEIIIHEATKNTWVEIVDKEIHPRIKYKDRHMEAAASPF